MLACELFPGPCWESKRSEFQSSQTREKKRLGQEVYAIQLALNQCQTHLW